MKKDATLVQSPGMNSLLQRRLLRKSSNIASTTTLQDMIEYLENHGDSPISVRDIAEDMCISHNRVHQVLAKLATRGKIEITIGLGRCPNSYKVLGQE